jgi:glycosyltransferase involved in cell wall biosynthesis
VPKVVHIPYCYHPDPVGGTEVYVAALARELLSHGFESVIAAPGASTAAYMSDGIRVRRFAGSKDLDLRGLYGAGDAESARLFGQILDEEKPGLVHLHAFTSGASLRLIRAAADRGLPTVFTYHTPTVSCQRGTLVRFGEEQCDGRLDVRRCAACTLQGLHMPKSISQILASIPPRAGRVVGNYGFSGGAWTALRMTELVELRHSAFRSLAAEVDRIVAPCRWVMDVLSRNQILSEKVTLCRQGLAQTDGIQTQVRVQPKQHIDEPKRTATCGSESDLRIVFLGRLDPTKGLHVLLHALQRIPRVACRLNAYVVKASGDDSAYGSRVMELAARDSRVTIHSALPAAAIPSELRGADILAVPSQGMETGPMVVLEAFAAGVPILGSRLGGIAELLSHGVNGLLVESDSATSWANAISQLYSDQQLLQRLRTGVSPPRRMSEVASEMSSLYAGLLSSREPRGYVSVAPQGVY